VEVTWPMRATWLTCLLLLGACGESAPALTEVLVVVDSDLAVPGELDELVFRVQGPSGPERVTSAPLGSGEQALPRSLALVRSGGALAPLTVRVEGLKQDSIVLARTATLQFVEGRTLVLPMHLVAACVDVECGAQTCTERGCESSQVDAESLASWNGQEPRLDGTSDPRDAGPDPQSDSGAGPQSDAGPDASTASDGGALDDGGNQCVPVAEVCNGADDDCDGETDDGFNLLIDEENCGRCGLRCTGQTRTCCNGDCAVTCT
jgi:hypothetical protein